MSTAALTRSLRSLVLLAHSASPTEPRPRSFFKPKDINPQKTKPSQEGRYETIDTVFLMPHNHQITQDDAVFMAQA